ncbi:alpha/beta hydrolase [Pontibacter sp. G13]|uniref:alpha/beta fold hydrolase n=1 Tax=Pontibacter sp. G13 TaxID=3074898 RepID=UPI00288A4624|nr:alpha/beta hydrolase [Pontibacter sp. G13]WNJ18284.1 alpha/beta hydrolase [Pontibacter sp. G13]
MNHIKIRGNTFAYQDLHSHRAETILLVHGHPFNHSLWKDQMDVLGSYRLLIPDLKGYGQSDYQFDKIFIEEQALDLALMLDALNIEQVHLVGLSMGGQIIVEFQRLFPARAQSMVICASTPHAETPESYQKRLALAAEIEQIGMRAYTEQDIHSYMNLDRLGTDSEAYLRLFQMMAETPTQGAIASHKGRAERRDNFGHLKHIHIPSLVIAGENDFFFDVEDVQKVAEEIPHAEFHIIPETGHLPNMEKPEEFNHILQRFYQRVIG